MVRLISSPAQVTWWRCSERDSFLPGKIPRFGCFLRRRGTSVKLQRHADPGQQLLNGEGFRDIIHRASVQSRHFIHHRVSGREKDHRHRVSFLLETAEDFKPVQSRKHDIQKEQIIAVLLRHLKGLPAVPASADLIAFMNQFQLHESCQFLFIFYDQNMCRHVFSRSL